MKGWICASAAAPLTVSMLPDCSGRSDSSSARARTAQAQTESQAESAKAEETSDNAETSNAANGSEAGVKKSEAADGPSAEGLEAAAETHHVEITIKDCGTIDVAPDGDNTPITVANFLKLAKDGFYDKLALHRIMSGFMIQGEDPLGTGTDGSDEEIKGEFTSNGVGNPLSHTRGAISMARSQIKDNASSQFFIVHENSTFLDKEYACSGYVTEGMEVVDAIYKDIQPVDNNGTIPKENQPAIQSIEVIDQKVSRTFSQPE